MRVRRAVQGISKGADGLRADLGRIGVRNALERHAEADGVAKLLPDDVADEFTERLADKLSQREPKRESERKPVGFAVNGGAQHLAER